MADFLWTAAPFVLGFFAIILIAIIILKLLINHREKKLAAQPQVQNRFDLDDEDLKNDNQ